MRVIDVHVGGAFNCSKAVLPDMMEKRAGKIINICSMMSELGRETVSAYAAAKGALKMLTKNIASEYGEYNICRKTVEENHTENCGSSGCDACGSTHRHDECGGLPGTVFSYDKNGAGW